MPRTQSINRQILAIAWPAIVSNITTPLLGLVDTAIAGHLGSAVYLGAIALGSTVFNLIYWLFGFLRMGTAGITAQGYGASDRPATIASLRRALFAAAGFGILLIVLSPWLGGWVLRFLDADDAAQLTAQAYFDIVIWGAPAMLASYSLNGWLIGMQNTRLPMFIALLTNVVNIVASLTFVFGFGLKIEGIACGTLVSQWVAVVACLLCVWHKYFRNIPCDNSVKGKTDVRFGRLFRINADIFLRTLCMVAVTAWFTRAGSSQGVNVLAANALLMQLFLFFSYFSDGFAYAGEALAGKFYGAGDISALRDVVHHLLGWSGGIAIVFTAMYFFCGEFILELLTDERIVVETAREYLAWAVSIPLCGTLAFVYDGVYVGLTRTRLMLASVAVALAAFFIVFFSLYGLMGNDALWLAFLCWLGMRGIVLHIALRRNM